MITRDCLAVFLVLLLLPVGCQRHAPSTPISDSAGQNTREPPRWRPEEVSNIPFHLVPLRREANTSRLKPTELVDKLFASLAEDESAKKLLIGLHNSADVTFRIRKLSSEEVERIAPKAPPAKGQTVLWFITGWSPEPVDDETEKLAPGRQLHMPVYLSWTYLTRLDGELPKSTEVLLAVVNDHLLRHDMGYQLKHGRLPARLEAMPGDLRPLSEIRAELDSNIEKLKRDVQPQEASRGP